MKNILLLLSSLLIVSLLSEILLREFYPPLISGWGWNDSPRRYLSDYENDFPNQIGTRGQQINYNDSDYVIVLLGDSQVESATSSPIEMPEILLEKYLNNFTNKNVKVFSLAASGWGQDQQLLALKSYYEKYRADLVLLWVTPKNDFWENTFPDRSVSKTAGHLKPTFRLINNNLSGVCLKPNHYYKNSALYQVLLTAWQVLKSETIEQLILSEWIDYLPSPHDKLSGIPKVEVKNNLEIDLNNFSQNVFNYSEHDDITILTYEDFRNSRSHFAPYLTNRSERDFYLINITKKLFEEIFSLSRENSSEVFVFYPLRHDFDYIYKNSIKYVANYHTPDLLFPVTPDYLSLIKNVIPKEYFFYFRLKGENNICVDTHDRHLNTIGNQEVMSNVSNYILRNVIKSDK